MSKSSETTKNKSQETVKVLPYKGSNGLSEIYQSSSISMAIASPTEEKNSYQQKSPYFKCCDFGVDSYTSVKQKYNFSIYGYSWNGETDILDFDEGRFLVKAGKESEFSQFLNNVKIIHLIEDRNNIPRTIVKLVEDQKNTALVICSGLWLDNCLTLRLYLYLVRICGYTFKDLNNWLNELREMSVSDGKYAKSIPIENWDKMLNDLNTIKNTGHFCGLKFKDGVSRLHHNSGIVSLMGSHSEISGSVVKTNKHYKILKERGFILKEY